MLLNKKYQQGISLVELVISITIIALALTSVTLAFFHATKFNSSPIANQQALLLAKSYLQEVMTKNFPNSLPCAPPPAARANYTNVCDYNNYTETGISDLLGNQLAGLETYTVQITLDSTTASLGSLTPGVQTIRIDVSVTSPKTRPLLVSGYKTRS